MTDDVRSRTLLHRIQREDPHESRLCVDGVSAESLNEVDDLVRRALAAGAQDLGEAQDDGFMYMRGFLDLDGHQWSFLYMGISAVAEQ